MKTYINTSSKFTVAVNEINRNKALLPYILHDKMSDFATCAINYFKPNTNSEPELFKINMLKNAYLNDVLKLRSQILLQNESEIHLLVEVYKRNDKDIICKASYKIDLTASSIGKAS